MTKRYILNEIVAALWVLAEDPSLAYIAVTSKPEQAIRDRVACYFHSKDSSLIAAREFRVKSKEKPKLRKTVDLVLLKPSIKPVAVVEFKAMIVPDALADPKHHLMIELKNDMVKLSKITDVPCFGVMVMVHIEDISALIQQGLDQGVVKYHSNFRKWAENDKAYREAVMRVRNFLARGQTRLINSLMIELGSVWHSGVKLACFVLERRKKPMVVVRS